MPRPPSCSRDFKKKSLFLELRLVLSLSLRVCVCTTPFSPSDSESKGNCPTLKIVNKYKIP